MELVRTSSSVISSDRPPGGLHTEGESPWVRCLPHTPQENRLPEETLSYPKRMSGTAAVAGGM